MMTAFQFSYIALPLVVTLATLVLLLAASDRAAPAASSGHALKTRLKHARMSRMLRRLDVDQRAYLQLPSALVTRQLDMCAACPHQFLCDQALACKKTATVDLSFCPNLLEWLRA